MKQIVAGGALLFVDLLRAFVVYLAALVLLIGAPAMAQEVQPKDLPILQKWTGDYPVSAIPRLPEGQRSSAVGFIGNGETFGAVWDAFEPWEIVPRVNFGTQLVVFSRNVAFYNRTSILKITLRDGVAEVLAAETMSARPIEDKVGMALAVILRAGIKFIQAGKERIPLEPGASAVDPLDATYTIEKEAVQLTHGLAEEQAAQGSATKIKTSVFGQPVFGDLDGDGKDDAALILLHQPGGSGSFYYVAAALSDNGSWPGTNAILLGDRIAPQNVMIRGSLIVVNYADRRPGEAMTVQPSVGKSKHLAVKEGRLVEIESLRGR
jgi:hypothetical protein